MDEGGDVLEMLGVFSNADDARKTMKKDFKSQGYRKRDCEEYNVEDNMIYVVGGLGFSYDHYWCEIVETEVK